MGKKPRKWLPIAEACEKLGRARRTLMTWRKQGCRGIKKRAGSLLVDCNQVEAWAHEQGKRPPAKAAAARARAARAAKAKAESGEQTAQPSNDSDSEDEVSLADAKLRKELALAKKHELHVAQAEGRLIPREEEEAGRLRRVEETCSRHTSRHNLGTISAQISAQILAQTRHNLGIISA